ncbi:MAG: signal peptidase I [Candidatus Spechtbacterales bacterium]|nr:signal peptidase I [Candidatus Spechtbacterales bacterium]
MTTRLRAVFDFIWDISKIIVVSLIIIIPIRYYVVQPFFVRGASMEPNYHQGDYLLVDEISYRFNSPQRGEVIIFRFPGNPSQFYIKRIIGLPGETVTIDEGTVIIKESEDGQGFELKEDYLDTVDTSGNLEITLSDSEYFVLGDNRSASHDSRRWGPLGENFIIGKVFLRAWPFDQFDLIEAPNY